jgi:hypothetical protein
VHEVGHVGDQARRSERFPPRVFLLGPEAAEPGRDDARGRDHDFDGARDRDGAANLKKKEERTVCTYNDNNRL